MHIIKLLASAIFYFIHTCIVALIMLPFVLLKLLPITSLRISCTRALNALASLWSQGVAWWINCINPVQWNINAPSGLSADKWYLLVCNHQSWVDILVLQKIFNRQIPFLKFFIKRELLYIPVIGQVWWALDYPFMRRGKSASSAKQDLITARKACEKFKQIPTSVISFVEGTRFTAEKHQEQQSPYTHLLPPKAGGIAITLDAMGDAFDQVLDVTITYPDRVPSFLDTMLGRLHAVNVTVRGIPVPEELLPQKGRSVQRAKVQTWLNTLWEEKDQTITHMQSNT